MPPASNKPPRRRRPLRTPGDPVSPFDAAAEDFDGWFDGEGKLVFASEVLALERVLPDLPRPWLEIGGGSGRFTASLGIDVSVDPSAGLLRLARGRHSELIRARGEHLPFDDHTFGTVFIITTLLFVEWPLSVLRETRRVLQPDGKLVLAEIPRSSPWGKLYDTMKEDGHPVYGAASLHSYSELIGIIERGSFSLEKIVSTLVQLPGEVREVEEPQSGSGVGAGFVVIVARKRGEE